MACGLPVIASEAGGNIELVDSTNGVLFPRGDAEALARALAELCKDREKRKSMGRRSLEKVKACYSWDRTMEELQEYYKELVRRRKQRSA
jgi:glycosyltransferase involved in cell wall biosynthesis